MKPIVAATTDEVRETLSTLASEAKVSLPALCRMLRRPASYLTRFVRGQGVEQLLTDEPKLLGAFFRVDPRRFGDREDWEPES